jgi:hypothetical protein
MSISGPHSGSYHSGRSSEASNANRFNFFDDSGTVRMQAFVDGLDSVGGGRMSQDSSVVLGGGGRRRNPRWSQTTSSTTADPRRSAMVFGDDFDAFDPFKGF